MTTDSDADDTDDIATRAAELAENTLLSPREAEAWVYNERGYSHSEIGDALGISPGTVASLLSRARDKLSKARQTVALLDPTDELTDLTDQSLEKLDEARWTIQRLADALAEDGEATSADE